MYYNVLFTDVLVFLLQEDKYSPLQKNPTATLNLLQNISDDLAPLESSLELNKTSYNNKITNKLPGCSLEFI